MNILVVVSDDMGMEQHSGFNGTEFEGTPADQAAMPNVDSIRTGGVRFLRFYVTPFCSPTRTQFYTGRYACRTGIGHVVDDDAANPLLEAEIALPELLKRGGAPHQTALIGKQHIANGKNGGLDALRRMGWDYHSGSPRNVQGAENYFTYTKLVQGEERPSSQYITTATVNDAMNWIRQQQANPWVCFVCFNAAHAPFHVPPDALRTGTWDPVNNTFKAFKAMQEAMDLELGRLLSIIDYSTTTVLYFPDNGTPRSHMGFETSPTKGPFNADLGKNGPFEPGVRVPLYVKGAAVGGAPRDVSALVQAVDLYPTLANLCGIDTLTPYLPGGWVVDGSDFTHLIDNSAATAVRDIVFTELFLGPLNANRGTNLGQRAAIEQRWKIVRGGTVETTWQSLADARFFDLAQLQTDNLFETDPTANLLGPGGDTSGLTAEQLAAYNDLLDKADAILESVDVDYALTVASPP